MKNPQAFPDPMRGAESSVINQAPWNLSEGMTLRDYFAAKALQSLIMVGSDHGKTLIRKATEKGLSEEEYLSQGAYEFADAMLKLREL